jgi:hypothetical protein
VTDRRLVPIATLILASLIGTAARSETEVGGDFRLYPFLVLEDIDLDRRHFEFAVLRGKLKQDFGDRFRLEADAVLELSSPPRIGNAASIVTGGTPRYLDLEWTVIDEDDVLGVASFDRLAVRWDVPSVRVVAGRQAVTWGVNYFWPVLDLFAPFAPERIDRDYKPGVDAVRVTVPLGAFSEVEVIVAAQGEDLSDDGSAASLGRFHSGSTDFGYMIGRFHTDDVVGGFLVTDVAGTAVRGEVAYTTSGDELDALRAREEFWRVTAGLDRAIAPEVFLTFEMHWNGFGSADPAEYRTVAESDRVRRGEVTSLARLYSGLSVSWQAHPLWSLSAAVLANWDDGSTLLQPSATWSSSDNSTVQLGLSLGIGRGLLFLEGEEEPQLGSEFGFVPVTLWGSYRLFF